MIEITGDLWDQNGWIVVPINLVGALGRGVAKQAKDKYPDADGFLRNALRSDHTPRIILDHRNALVFFPTKHHWKDASDLVLIRQMLHALGVYPTLLNSRIYLPLIGCGYGGLYAEEVLPLLRTILKDDRFVLVRRGKEVRERYPVSFKEATRVDASLDF